MTKLQYALFLAFCGMLVLASYQIRVLNERRAKQEIRAYAFESVTYVQFWLPAVEAKKQENKLMEDWLRCDGECK